MASQGNPLIKSSDGDSKFEVPDVGVVTNGNLKPEGDRAIGGVIARVHLERYNFDDFYTNKGKYLQLNEPKKRGRKRKLLDFQQEGSDNAGVEIQTKRRGRPKKIGCDEPVEDESSEEAKQRGRPKVDKQLNQLSAKPSADGHQRWNGGDSTDSSKYSSPRIRKPNSRLQDFIVASDARYYGQLLVDNGVKDVASVKATEVKVQPTVLEAGKPKKEILVKPQPQEKSLGKMNETTGSDSDPLDISDEVDVVRSFLPVFDNTQQSRGSGVVPKVQVNQEKENQTNNLQSKLKKNSTTQQPLEKDEDDTTYSSSKSCQKSVSHSAGPAPENLIPKKSGPKGPKRNLSPGSAVTGTSPKKIKLNDSAAKPVVVVQKSVKAKTASLKSKVAAKVNGSNRIVKQTKASSSHGLCDGVGDSSKAKPMEVDFNRLVRSLKLVQLPARNWKIRIVVSKHQTITEVTFTNKEVFERCVKFSRTFTGFVVSFGRSVVKLLGAPSKLTSLDDVSILLNIVHNLSPSDMVLEYCTSTV